MTEIEFLDDTLNSHVGKKISALDFSMTGCLRPESRLDTASASSHRSCGSFAGHLRQSVSVCRMPLVCGGLKKAKVKPVAEKHQSKSDLGAELFD